MAEIVPFRGLRYDERKAGDLTALICPPYDVINDADREALLARSPYNFVRVEHAKSEPGDHEGQDKYTRARAAVEAWTTQGVLRRDTAPAFYVHDHYFELGGRQLRRRGFFGALRLYPLDAGVVLPHEQTIPKDKGDRLTLLRATRVNTSPIFGMFEDANGRVAAMLEELTSGEARRVGEARVGSERHVLSAIDGAAPAEELRGALRDARIYLADGHHRYEVALEYLNEETAAKRVHDADDAASFVLTYLCALDDPGLRILATHRIVSGARAAMDAAVVRSFDPAPVDRGALADTQPGIVLVRDGTFTRLEPKPSVDLAVLSEAWRSLPVAQAEALLIEPARRAGGDVRYEHDGDKAIDAAVGQADAVLIRAVDAMTLKKVADEGERLPPKTTYFYPKVPAGLVARPLEA
ncbi:MAG: DUF1015 domain-containing protein [Chloroflexota bacterium]|nr:DUF1015 domain-containing protein [Chloroflexota bacterium]